MADKPGAPELDFNAETVTGEGNAGGSNLWGSNPHHEDSYMTENSEGRIKESQPPPRRPGRDERAPVRFPNTGMVIVDYRWGTMKH